MPVLAFRFLGNKRHTEYPRIHFNTFRIGLFIAEISLTFRYKIKRQHKQTKSILGHFLVKIIHHVDQFLNQILKGVKKLYFIIAKQCIHMV